MKKNLTMILMLAMLFAMGGCTGDPAQPPVSAAQPTDSVAESAMPSASVPETTKPVEVLPTESEPPASTPAPDPVAEQMAAMTLEEKVGQLFIAGFYGTEDGDYVDSLIRDYKVGGLIFFGRNVGTAQELVSLVNDLRAKNGDYIPLFFSVDQEGGTVERLPDEVSPLEDAYTYGQSGSSEVGYALGQVLANECVAFGFNLDFAPSLDIWSNPENTVIGTRAFGTTAEEVEAVGPWAAYGLMDGGVIPVVKHFPGHGDTAVDSHVGLPTVSKTVDELLTSELIPFQSAIEGREGEGVPAVMVAHILMTAIDPDHPASLSQAVVTGLLREQLGFDGVVFTDDLTMGAITENYGLDEAAVLALEAGCDVLLVCHNEGDLALARQAVLDAVASGRLTEERIDRSVYRILSLKQAYGLTNAPIETPDLQALNQEIAALNGRTMQR